MGGQKSYFIRKKEQKKNEITIIFLQNLQNLTQTCVIYLNSQKYSKKSVTKV